MEEIAGWVAPAATMIAAMMTAANLGARFTGWGFVVFLVGSLAWVVVALTTGQQNLLLANGFLTVVNVVGIWRWLGRQARYADGAEAASKASAKAPSPKLFPLSGLEGRQVVDRGGEQIGQVVGAMAECGSGRIAYFVLREGGLTTVEDRLHAVGWRDLTVHDDSVEYAGSREALETLPLVEPDRWPARAP